MAGNGKRVGKNRRRKSSTVDHGVPSAPQRRTGQAPPTTGRTATETNGKTSGGVATNSAARSSESSGMIEALAQALLAHDPHNQREPNELHDSRESHESYDTDSSSQPPHELTAQTDETDNTSLSGAPAPEDSAEDSAEDSVEDSVDEVETFVAAGETLTTEEGSVTHSRDSRDHAFFVGEREALAQTAMQAYSPQDDAFTDEATPDERPTVIITNDGANTFAEFSLPDDTPEDNTSAHTAETNQAEAGTDPHTTNPTGHPIQASERVPRPARQLRASSEQHSAEQTLPAEQDNAGALGTDASSGESLTARPTPRIASDPNAPEIVSDEDTAVHIPSLEPHAQSPSPAAYMPQPPQSPQPAQPAHPIPQAAGGWTHQPHQHAQGAPGAHAHYPGRGLAHQGQGQPQAPYPYQGQPPQQPPPQQPQPHQWAAPPPALMGAPLSPLAAPPPAAGVPPLAAADPQKPSHAPWAIADSWGESTFNGPNTAAGLSYLFGWVSGVIIYFGERRNRYVRFHAAQSILLTGALTILGVILFTMLELFGDVAAAAHQPVFYHLGLFIALLGLLGMFLLWFIPMVAAWNGYYLRIPVIADYAERYAAPPREIYPDQ